MKLNTLLVFSIVDFLILPACTATPTPITDQTSDYEDSVSPTSVPVIVTETSLPIVIPPTSAPTGMEAKVQISGSVFSPSKLEVKAGTIVIWKNNGSMEHTVEADDGSFVSNPLDRGDTFSFTFNTAGSYSYHCGIHVNMKGIVTVTP